MCAGEEAGLSVACPAGPGGWAGAEGSASPRAPLPAGWPWAQRAGARPSTLAQAKEKKDKAKQFHANGNGAGKAANKNSKRWN